MSKPGIMMTVKVAAMAIGAALSAGYAIERPVSAQSAKTTAACDKRLKPLAGPWAYGPRGDRCEGLYEQLVSPEGALQVVSFVVADRPIVVPETYRLKWPGAGPAQAVTVRAAAVADRRFFRMDTIATGTAYAWDTRLLRDVGAQAPQVGVTAAVESKIGGVNQTVYLPADLGQLTGRAPHKYVLWLSSPANLADAWLSVEPLNADGSAGKAVIRDQPLGHPHYIATGPVSLTFDLSKHPKGLYRVQVGATYIKKGTASMTMVIRHDG